jgi:ABC-type dipeptide/oligopeptide/nickel transport system permease subunit
LTDFTKRPNARETLRRAGVTSAAGTIQLQPEDGLADGEPPLGAGPEREFTVAARSQSKMVLRRFLRHKLAMASFVVLILLALLAFVGARLWKYTYRELTPDASQAPSWSHPFGTDQLGRDYLAQVLQGAQKSIQIALIVALLATTLGVLIGAISGYFRGWTDGALMRVVDLFLTVPTIAIAACLGRQLSGGDWWLLAIILSVVLWTSTARIIRGEFLSLREKEFVEAARAIGASDRRIIFKHMLPNVVGPVIVSATLVVATAILLETALSYLGLGVKRPDTSLGLLVSDYQTAFQSRPWLFWFPGLFIIVIALSINFIGDGLRDAFDPRQTRVRA